MLVDNEGKPVDNTIIKIYKSSSLVSVQLIKIDNIDYVIPEIEIYHYSPEKIGLNNYSIREVAYARDNKEKLSKVFSESKF